MQFRLRYEGPLKSGKSSTPGDKHRIRESFHPQLKQLWDTHNLLSNYRVIGNYEGINDDPWSPYSRWASSGEKKLLREAICEHKEFTRCGISFVPLVCKKLQLHCSLDILLLTNGSFGVVENGDIDNRLKTLFDALKMPTSNELRSVRELDKIEDPFFCLLEDDKFITSLSVESDVLWSESSEKNCVNLVIAVNIKPTYATNFNVGFS